MSEGTLQKYVAMVRSNGDKDSASDGATVDGFGAFGWLRGIRERALMLELRKRSGNSLAVDYGGMEIEFDPSEGITLHVVSGRKIRIRGKNLDADVRPGVRLLVGLTLRRVPWIQETDNAGTFLAEKNTTVIDGIDW